MASILETSYYLVVEYRPHEYLNRRKLSVDRIVKRTDSRPACKNNQVPILVTVSLPEALFLRPEISVRIDVDGDAPRIDIDSSTESQIAERIREIIGVGVHVDVAIPETEDHDH